MSTGSELRPKLEATKKIDQGLIIKLRAFTLECSKNRVSRRKACKNKYSPAIVSFFGSNCSWSTPLKSWCGRLTKSLMTDPIWRSKIQYDSQIFDNQSICTKFGIRRFLELLITNRSRFFLNLPIGTKFDILGFLGVANYESEDRFWESNMSNPI